MHEARFVWRFPSASVPPPAVAARFYRGGTTLGHAIDPTFRAKNGRGTANAIRRASISDHGKTGGRSSWSSRSCGAFNASIETAFFKQSDSRPGVAERGGEEFRRW